MTEIADFERGFRRGYAQGCKFGASAMRLATMLKAEEKFMMEIANVDLRKEVDAVLNGPDS